MMFIRDSLLNLAMTVISIASIFSCLASASSILGNLNISSPEIVVIGPKTMGGVVCLPEFVPLQDFDPMKPKSIDSYTLPKYDESGYIGPTKNIEQDVLDLLSNMTLQEKIGQMSVSHVLTFIGCDGELNRTVVEHAFKVLKLGFVYGCPSDIFGRWALNSPQRYANFSNTIQEIALSSGSKAPVMYGIDSLRGANFVKGATGFPAPVNQAATFNPIHAYNTGKIGAKDTRAAGQQWIYGPATDLNVNRMWSRNFENYGEDPYLNGQMTYNNIKGLQGNYKKDRSRVAATFKHFIAYSATYDGKDQEPRYVPMNSLLEYHVPSFKKAIEAGSATGMESYSSLNGQDVVSSKKILKDLLRDQLKFYGTLSTDLNENLSQFTKHQTAFNTSDATIQVYNNTSIDVQLMIDSSPFILETPQLVQSGKISLSRVDQSVARILQLKKDIGLFESPYSDPSLIDTVGSLQDVELSRNAARESIILLKNENNILPLSPNEKVLYVGTSFNSTRYLAGGRNVHSDGPTDLEGDAIFSGYGDTILLGVEKVTGKKTNWITGYSINGKRVDGYENIVREARKADKVVFCFGQDSKRGLNANLNTLRLPQDQYDIAKRVIEETTTPVILLLTQNQPFSLGELSTLADGVINAHLPGVYGGLPIAEALFGVYSPSGRQPYTYPKYDYQSMTNYYTPIWNEYSPEYAFGQGLGYNNITYSNITVSSETISASNPLTVSITATNNGKLPQMEPALMFTTQTIRRGYSPEKYRLRAFDKKLIAPGASYTFTFNLTAQEMMFYNIDLEKVLEEGPVDITINAFNKNAKVKSIYMNGN
ncbi:Lysosomal beta glucosidase [Smittium mucronatum]|uniref:beta-glucosidase n=1 Tax=Smittium mucronatum TaxID=133383 RepID=A0A1R0H940_9FUNG|nr:Lysosomal beta glucosidase [Smittium mucronatum]